jgi:hypothetical protein
VEGRSVFERVLAADPRSLGRQGGGVLFSRSRKHEDWAVTLTLPTKWTPLADSKPGLLAFRDDAGKQLTVGTLRLRDPPNGVPALTQAVRNVYEARMMSERQFMEPSDPLNAHGINVAADGPVGFFSGARRTRGRMFSGIVVGKGADVVTFYLEGPVVNSADVKDHLRLVAELFKGLRLKGNV